MKKYLPEIRQIIKFGIVGVSNTAVGYLIYVVALYLFKKRNLFAGYDYLVAQVLMFATGVLWSFFWNKKITFKDRDKGKKHIVIALLKSYIMYSFTGIMLSGVMLVIWIRYFGISEFFAPIVNLIFTVPLNFIISKKWVYGK